MQLEYEQKSEPPLTDHVSAISIHAIKIFGQGWECRGPCRIFSNLIIIIIMLFI